MSKFTAPESREIIKEIQIDEMTWAVMGREPFRSEEYQYCTWIGNRYGLESGHYSMSKAEAEADLQKRAKLGF